MNCVVVVIPSVVVVSSVVVVVVLCCCNVSYLLGEFLSSSDKMNQMKSLYPILCCLVVLHFDFSFGFLYTKNKLILFNLSDRHHNDNVP